MKRNNVFVKKWTMTNTTTAIIIPLSIFLLVVFISQSFFSNYKMINPKLDYNIKVEDVFEYRGELFINDSISLGSAYDNQYPPNHLLDFIEVGDSISIGAHNDTIKLFKRNKEFWFVHQEFR